jgi:hypothetical protein
MKKPTIIFVVILYLILLHLKTYAQIINTIAGGGKWPYNGTLAINSSIDVSAIKADSLGNIFFTDGSYNCLRKISTSGIIFTIAGDSKFGSGGEGKKATETSLGSVNDNIIFDRNGNIYFSQDSAGVTQIKKVSSAGVLTTIAGNKQGGSTADNVKATEAKLNKISKLAIDSYGQIYFGDYLTYRIRKIDTLGIIRTVVGNGVKGYDGDGGLAISANINSITGLAIDNKDNLYFSDANNYVIRKVTNSGIITTVAGNGTNGNSEEGSKATSAKLLSPYGIAVDSIGNIYFIDGNVYVRKITSTGNIENIAGNGILGDATGDGGDAKKAQLGYPFEITIDKLGNLYFGNKREIRKISSSGIISRYAGNGSVFYSGDGGFATNAEMNQIEGISIDNYNNLFVVDENRIRKITSDGIITTIAGNGKQGFSGDGGLAIEASLNDPSDIIIDTLNNIYIAENNRIRKVTPEGIISTYAGNGNNTYSGDEGLAINAGIGWPTRLTIDSNQNIYFTDNLNSVVRVISINGIIKTVAGTGIRATSSQSGDLAIKTSLFNPFAITLDNKNNIYFSDLGANIIRKVTKSNGIISTIAGTTNGYNSENGLATLAQLISPQAIALDSISNIYIGDNTRLRKIINSTGVISTIGTGTYAGTAISDGDGEGVSMAKFQYIKDLAIDKVGNIYISDGNKVRKIFFSDIFTQSVPSYLKKCQGVSSKIDSFFVYGNGLKSKVEITSTKYIEISTNPTTEFSSKLLLELVYDSVPKTKIYIKQKEINNPIISIDTIKISSLNQTTKYFLIQDTIFSAPPSPIINDTSYCKNALADTIRANATSGNFLLWYDTNATGGTATKTAIKPSTLNLGTNSYYVSQMNINTGCESARARIDITIKPIPSAPLLSRDSDNNLVANTKSITWYKDGVKIADTTQKIKPTSNGNYTATTTQNGCTSSASANYYYLTSAVANLSSDEYFKVSPNPTNGEIYLNYYIRTTTDVYISVFDMSGRTIISNRKVNNGSKLNLGTTMKGNYIIQVKDKSGRLLTTEKLIKN